MILNKLMWAVACALLLSVPLSSQTCPDGDLILTTQNEIDSFAINYPGCTELPGSLIIEAANSDLRRLDGLAQLITINGDLIMRNSNNVLDFDGFQRLRRIRGSLWIRNNFALEDLDAFTNLWFIDGNLQIEFQVNITDLRGLAAVRSIGGDLILQYNNKLSTLSDLTRLESVSGKISITHMNTLQNLDGLEDLNVSAVEDLEIVDCRELSVCDIESVCSYLDNNGTATIMDNAEGCNSVEEVVTACTTTSTEVINLDENIVVWPNPTSDFVSIYSNEKVSYGIWNIHGKLIAKGNTEKGEKIDVRDLPVGTYFVQVQVNDELISKKLIKK